MNEIFDWCVKVLQIAAAHLGTTYKAINVWIFCIIEPIVFIWMLFIIIRQRRSLRRRP